MSLKLTLKELDEIKDLLEKALSICNKKEAEPFVKRLKFICITSNIESYSKSVLDKVVKYTNEAAGQVKDKEHWSAAAREEFIHLQSISKEEMKS